MGKPAANAIKETEMLLAICSLAYQNKKGAKIVPLFLDRLPERIFLFYSPFCMPARQYLSECSPFLLKDLEAQYMC